MKHQFIFFFTLLSLPVLALSPRLTVSPFAGVNLATFSVTLNNDLYEISPSILPGASFGVQLRFKLADRYTLLTAPSCIRKGSHIRVDWDEHTSKSTYRVQYISIPVRIEYSPFSKLPYILAGAGINFKLDDMEYFIDEYLINGEDVVGVANYKPVIKTADLDWTLEAGIGMPFRLFQKRCFAEALYLYGLSDIYDDVNKDQGGFWTRGIVLHAGFDL